MKDPAYMQKMRQDLISGVFKDIHSDSKFCIQTTDGSDALINTID